jgi:flagellum-specific peptidoglycan hydrolase FlgJ
MVQIQRDFLNKAYKAACSAKHLYPEFAVCEAAVESAWGTSRLAIEANNLFGQKQSHPPLPQTTTLALPTREFLNNQWVTIEANWVKFAGWDDSFRARMALLKRLSATYPHYAAALAASSGEEFAIEVSKSWSTDPQRAAKVMEIHAEHRGLFVAANVAA